MREKIKVQFGTGEADAYPFTPPCNPTSLDCDKNGEIYVFNDLGYRTKCIPFPVGAIMQQCTGVPYGWMHTDLWFIEQDQKNDLIQRIAEAIHGQAPLSRTP